MYKQIQAEILSLYQILIQENKFYKVPNYQRPYSWGKDNVFDLVDELVKFYDEDKDKEYFCGSLVLVKNDKDKRFSVIDGQQRLTTFTLLACVIKDTYEHELSQEAKECLLKSIQDSSEKSELKFLVDEHYQAGYKNTFILHKIDFKDKINIEQEYKDDKYLQNAHYLRKALRQYFTYIQERNINDFVFYIYDKVKFSVITCLDEAKAIQVFNILNTTGMPLSSTDILKSSLMQKLSLEEDRNAFKHKWQKIAEFLRESDLLFDEMLYCYLYYTIARNPQKRLDQELLATQEFKDKNPIEIIEDIEKFASLYKEVLENKENNPYIHCLKHLPHEIYYASILTTAKFIKFRDFDELVKCLVGYFYQNFIALATASRFKQTCFNILKALKVGESLGSIKQIMSENLDKHNTTQSYKALLESEADFFVYRWVKPVFLMLEYLRVDSNAHFIKIDNKLHLEHVLPQHLSAQKEHREYWEERFNEEERKIWCNDFANLILLHYRKNIQAQNYHFDRKKEVYSKADDMITSFHTTRDVLDEQEWNITTLKQRKQEIIDKINKEIDIF